MSLYLSPSIYINCYVSLSLSVLIFIDRNHNVCRLNRNKHHHTHNTAHPIITKRNATENHNLLGTPNQRMQTLFAGATSECVSRCAVARATEEYMAFYFAHMRRILHGFCPTSVPQSSLGGGSTVNSSSHRSLARLMMSQKKHTKHTYR